jgi:DNA-binding transcriptional regulator PaaX
MRPYAEITKQILLSVGIAGAVVIVAATPGVLLAAKLFEQDKQRFSKKYKHQKGARVIQKLKKNRLLTIKEKQGKFVVELTEEGKKKFKEIQLKNLQITKPPHWDKKLRIITFDIPDKSFKRGRDALRGKLKQWEFYPLQKSVWVCPWPCENEIRLITELYGVSDYISIIVAESISNDTLIKKHFGL